MIVFLFKDDWSLELRRIEWRTSNVNSPSRQPTESDKKGEVLMSQVAYNCQCFKVSFCSMKQLGVLLLPPWMVYASPSQGDLVYIL